jgi:Got1/Sft2-like family
MAMYTPPTCVKLVATAVWLCALAKNLPSFLADLNISSSVPAGVQRLNWDRGALLRAVGVRAATAPDTPDAEDENQTHGDTCGVVGSVCSDGLLPAAAAAVATTLDPGLVVRAKASAALVGLGVLALAGSAAALPAALVSPRRFAVLFAGWQALVLLGFCALVGVQTQVGVMFGEGRAGAVVAYAGTLGFALWAAFCGGRARYLFVLLGIVLHGAVLG